MKFNFYAEERVLTFLILVSSSSSIAQAFKQPEWFKVFEWPLTGSGGGGYSPASSKPYAERYYAQPAEFDEPPSSVYGEMIRAGPDEDSRLQAHYVTSQDHRRRSQASERFEWPPSVNSRHDYYTPLENQHHHTKHEMEHGKEVGLAYPVLLSLLLLGALFIPFLSLFFFLAVSAFNCHGSIGGALGGAGGLGAGFQPVAPVFGRRRRKRRKRDLAAELLDTFGWMNSDRMWPMPMILPMTQQAPERQTANATRTEAANKLLKNRTNSEDDDDWRPEGGFDLLEARAPLLMSLDLDWHDRLDANWIRVLRALSKWLDFEPSGSAQTEPTIRTRP